jgi:hypothetical protein
MVWLKLIGGFLLFMGLIGAAHALDRYAGDRYGYRPVAPPNLAFMLIPHGILVAWAAGLIRAPGLGWALAVLGAGALSFMLVILQRRTSVFIAAAAAGLMLTAAPILLLSMLFSDLADSPPGR